MFKKLLIIVLLIVIVVILVFTKTQFTGEIAKIFGSEEEIIEIGDKRIKLISTYCTDGELKMEIRNEGNVRIAKSELRVLINHEEKTDNFIDKGINSGETISYSDSITSYSGSQYIRVEGPDNTISWGIKC